MCCPRVVIGDNRLIGNRLFMHNLAAYAESALLYENTGGVTACFSHLEVATYEAPQVSLSSNGYAGRLVTTERPWADIDESVPRDDSRPPPDGPITVQLRE